MYTTSIAIQILPDVSDIKKVCEIVDEVIAYIESTGCHYEVGPEKYSVTMEIISQKKAL